VGFGAKFNFFGSVYLYEKLNYVNGCVRSQMVLEATPIKVLSEPIVLLKFN
jgi:hypothetical protein